MENTINEKTFYYISIDENNKIISRQSSTTEIQSPFVTEVSLDVYNSDCLNNFWDKTNQKIIINKKVTKEEILPTELEIILQQQEKLLKKLETIENLLKE